MVRTSSLDSASSDRSTPCDWTAGDPQGRRWYLPLDPEYPAERLAFMLEDARVPVLFTQTTLRLRLHTTRVTVICLDAWAPGIRVGNAHPSAGLITCGNVIYTSGSTGKPKGVQIPHRAVVNLLTSMRERPGLRDTDVWLAITTLSFDIAALEIFFPSPWVRPSSSWAGTR